MMLSLLTVLACTSSASDSVSDTSGGQVPVNPEMVETTDGVYEIYLSPGTDPFVFGEEVTLDMHITQEGAGLTGLTVEVEPFMPDMGHGISTGVSVEELSVGEPGVYQAAFVFSMAGYWELTVDASGSQAVIGYDVE